jgi:putative heme-binding domain-containing protein
MRIRATSALIFLALAPLLQAQTEVPKQNPHTSAADVERGKRLFANNCAPCHGPRGAGGRGANLAQPKLPRAADDPSLFDVIRNGLPGTEMPPGWWVMDDRELWQVAAYVRTLGAVPSETVRGDPQSGRILFKSKGCIGCHQVAAEGGRMGPPLTDIGLRRGAEYLRAAMLDPSVSVPEDFLLVRLDTKDGKRVEGIRLNEDTWSIQVRDNSDRLLSFWKDDLASLDRQTGKSPMPGYRERLTRSELDDLTAYLISLKGDR